MEAGRIVITLLTIVLTVITWYSFLRHKRIFPIVTWLAWIVLILNVADIVMTLNGWAIFNSIIMVLVIVMLQVEKNFREKKESIENANAEKDAVEPSLEPRPEDPQR